jgi:hypothetical protein
MIAVILVAIFFACVSVRNACVRAALNDQPETAARYWPAVPEAIFADRMAAIGRAVAAHRPVEQSMTRPVIDAARRSPLSPEPFLVRGVQAQEAGNEALAGAAFLAAERRDPRAPAPHFFLSDHYSRIGRADLTLNEMGQLISVVPGSAATVEPKIAASIRQIGGVPGIKQLVAGNAQLRDSLLLALASDVVNATVVLSVGTLGEGGAWQTQLIQTLVTADQFDRAFDVWSSINSPGVVRSARPLLNDVRFQLKQAPPFGWALTMSGPGAAEPQDNGQLHVLYYGREQFIAAGQLLMLRPGRYTISYEITPAVGDPQALSWQLSCLPHDTKLPLSQRRSGRRSAVQFVVPSGCAAQRLELIGTPPDLPNTTELTLGNLALRREP